MTFKFTYNVYLNVASPSCSPLSVILTYGGARCSGSNSGERGGSIEDLKLRREGEQERSMP
jgi:hypothetical protein